MTTITRAALIVSGFLFVAMAGVQYNDEDAVFWMPLYCISAALAFGAAAVPIKSLWPSLYAVAVAIVAAAGMWLFGNDLTLRDVEVTREFGGLLIVIVHAAVVARVARSPFHKWVDGRPLA
jgi:hypothetical protein